MRQHLIRGFGAASALLGALLAGGCGTSASAPVPAVTSPPVPGLGALVVGQFPQAWDGRQAQLLCDEWAGLRADYVTEVKADSPHDLDIWFSGPRWVAAWKASRNLKSDTNYGHIYVSFSSAVSPDIASVDNARLLDQACIAEN